VNGLGRTLLDILADEHPDHRLCDPDTSVQAAADNRANRETQRMAVLANIVHAWRTGTLGCTDFEHPGIQQTSAGKRRLELQRAGLVEPTEMRRATPSGSMSTVWKPTIQGVQSAPGPR
jgi:hypothetical protein